MQKFVHYDGFMDPIFAYGFSILVLIYYADSHPTAANTTSNTDAAILLQVYP